MPEEIMLENELLKIKIKQYQSEYLRKKGILRPDGNTKILMRKAVSSRLKNEIHNLTQIHKEITNKIELN